MGDVCVHEWVPVILFNGLPGFKCRHCPKVILKPVLEGTMTKQDMNKARYPLKLGDPFGMPTQDGPSLHELMEKIVQQVLQDRTRKE
jgi:hypothetical protein